MDGIKEQAEMANEIQQLKARVAELEALVKFYEEQTRLAKQRQFGASSEKTENYEQLGLFDEPETTAEPKAPEPTLEMITYTRKKRVGKREDYGNWVIRCAEDWLLYLYSRLKELLLKELVLHADETVLQVLRELGKKANTNAYEWLYRTSGCAEHPIVLYEYQPTRSSAHPKAFLKGYTGYLHTDGYQGYHALPGVTVVGCWAHARRKFDEALKAMPADQRAESAAAKGLDFCNRLFMLERAFTELSADERHQERLKQSKPAAEALLSWAKSINALPKSLLGKAVTYLLEQWPYLNNLFLDGRLELSNNRAERSIKPFVIGRKNWLFSNSVHGAKASSVIYSIVETAKENGLKPYEYMKFLLERIPNMPLSELDTVCPGGVLSLMIVSHRMFLSTDHRSVLFVVPCLQIALLS